MVPGTADEGRYEWLRGQLPRLQPASRAGERDLLWVDAQRQLAVARDHRGRIEVFVVGPAVTARTRVVLDSLEHESWKTSYDSLLEASRVVLPRGAHYDGIAAFICTELLDNGIQSDVQGAFSRTEPVLALALTRARLGDEVMVGLAGELALLRALVMAAPEHTIVDVLGSWAGSSPSARDFQLGTVGVEVKATTGPSSLHHVQGVHQVELGHSNRGVPETHLYLLSLGISWVDDDEGGTTIPALVDAILNEIDETQLSADFLARVKQYGGDAAIGYDHDQDRGRARYNQHFSFTFERLYDMRDERIHVLRARNLQDLDEVDPGSVSFRIRLKDEVRGEVNPLTGMIDATRAISEAAGLW